MKDRVLLAVDLSNAVWKATAVNANLTSEDRFTGGLYGFLMAMAKAITATGATDVVICEDRRPYVRSLLYPEYKSLRQTNRDEEMYTKVQYTVGLVKEAMAVVGWPLWGVPGFESDDLIGLVATRYRHRYKQVIAVSNDSDLHQLFHVNAGFAIYKGKKGLYTKDSYKQEWDGMLLEHLQLALALMGTHNEVQGVRGIGEVTARDIVSHPWKLRLALEKHADIVQRNLELINLPHKDLPSDTVMPDYSRRFIERDFLRFCGRFDINIQQDQCQAFERIGKK